MRSLKWFATTFVVVLLVVAGMAWWQRQPLMVWWTVRGLSQADEGERQRWVDQVARLGDATIAPLLEHLTSADDRACQNALAALDQLGRTDGVGSPGTVELLTRLARPYSRLSPPLQGQLLHTVAAWFTGDAPAEGLLAAVVPFVAEAAVSTDADVQTAGMALATVLLRQPGGEVAASAARDVVRGALGSSSAAVRLKAVRLSLQPGMELVEQLIGLLRDPSVEVRRAAILAVGPAEQLVREDVLLPGLHDEDAEVRKHTESALRARGLRPEHLELGRLLTHPQPGTRLQVVDRLRGLLDGGTGGEVDLDPGVWLRRLSHDSSPAVRVAALRLMSQQQVIDLKDRIEQMARNDPSPTVIQLAQYYARRKE